MKKMRRIFALMIIAVLTLGFGTSVLAAKNVTVGTGTGSITLSNGTTGESYQLYKVFDATYNDNGNVAYTFTKTDANSDFYTALTDSASPFTVTATAATNVYTVVQKDNVEDSDILAWVETNVKDKDYMKVGSAVTLEEADEQAIEWTSLAFGYYLITSTLEDFEEGKSFVTIDSNVPDVTVIDKNQTATFDKNIALEPPAKANEAEIGEDIPFAIDVKSKNYVGDEKVFKYVISDTLDNGFTYKEEPVVKIANEEKTAPGDYTITYKDSSGNVTSVLKDAQSFEIVIPWTTDGTINGTHLYLANDEIEVTYTAFLDADKYESITVGGTTGNKNTADVKFFKGTDTTEPSGDLPDVITNSYDTSITIHKTDGSQALAGAEFKLTSDDASEIAIVTGQEFVAVETGGTHWKLKDGTYTTTDPATPGIDTSKYDSTTQKYALQDIYKVIDGTAAGVDLKAFVKADGTLTFSGLGAGTYTLTETVVPEGYNKAEDITFTISFDPETKTFSSDNALIVTDGTTNVFSATIVNNTGTELPSTGGIGTTIFYIIGAILVIGAGVTLVARRRVNVK